MRPEARTMMTRRRILITDEDMARLRELVRHSRKTSRKDQNHLEELHAELDSAEVVTRDLDSGKRAEYTLVFPTDADIERSRISVLAPIGTALIGYSAGDIVEWVTPGGTRRLEIESVLFQPEAAGDAVSTRVRALEAFAA